jgi:hypothetical protein
MPPPAPGVVDTVDGIERLTLFVHSEPFDNGAVVSVRVRLRADRPREVALAAFTRAGSAPLAVCVLTATMGNFARLRRLHLRLSEYLPSRAALRGRQPSGTSAAGPDAAMTRLSAAKRRAQVPSHDSRAVPDLRASAPAAAASSTTSPDRQIPAEQPAAPPSSVGAPADDDQLARLLAAKQRARKKRDG